MFVPSLIYQKEIVSLIHGFGGVETRFVRNIFGLGGEAVREIKITGTLERGKPKGLGCSIAKVRFRHFSISGARADHALHLALASKGLIGELRIYCHSSLEERKAMEKEFRSLREIELKHQQVDVRIEETEYSKLIFDRVRLNCLIPEVIFYRKNSHRYPFPFPFGRITVRKVFDDKGFKKLDRRLKNPPWTIDRITMIDRVIKRNKIKIDSVYVDGSLEHYRKKFGYWMYNPVSAKIIFRKDKQKLVTPAPCEYAIALSYLNLDTIWFKDVTQHPEKHYTV